MNEQPALDKPPPGAGPRSPESGVVGNTRLLHRDDSTVAGARSRRRERVEPAGTPVWTLWIWVLGAFALLIGVWTGFFVLAAHNQPEDLRPALKSDERAR